MNKSNTLKTVLTVGGAFAAYNIGAGFATGQEAMQYFGSHGGYWPIILLVIMTICMFIFCFGTYKFSSEPELANPNNSYTFYCGKYLGRVVDVLSTLNLVLCAMVMFAGSGATINQYLGIPVWIGTIAMGIVSVVVVCLGLERVTDVLGLAGVLIIILLCFTGLYTFITSDVGLLEAEKNVSQYVSEGIILQGSFLGLTNNPVLAVIGLCGSYITLALVFNVALGGNCKGEGQILGGSVCSIVFFIGGYVFVLFSMLLNLDYIAETKASVPMLAAVTNVLPKLTLPFSILIVVGVFTTVTGYLWAVGRRFAPDRTKKQAIVVIVMAVVSISVASMVPLANLVNVIFPILSLPGLAILIGVIYRLIKGKPKSTAVNADAATE